MLSMEHITSKETLIYPESEKLSVANRFWTISQHIAPSPQHFKTTIKMWTKGNHILCLMYFRYITIFVKFSSVFISNMSHFTYIVNNINWARSILCFYCYLSFCRSKIVSWYVIHIQNKPRKSLLKNIRKWQITYIPFLLK